ncbi:MAG: 3-deoxy-D-manno-octulosonic acid transferase [Candidatus Omnitrophica bacterium]|nr:3-deoxy-D-manno-octulosonic acid transferase [Candidatus Omnitrophota bacterium]
MFIIYDLIFMIFAFLYLPLYLLGGKFHQGFARRLGSLPEDLNLDRPIWIHAVSVGEVISIKELVTQLRKIYPQKKIVISTVTATGNKIARGLVNKEDFLTYLPLDFSFIISKVLKRINPCVFIIAETEIWPNLISCLYKHKIPVVTVNGRISDNSYGGYRAIKLFIRPVLNKVSQFCLQSDVDALRLQNLGVRKENIQVTGNVKFDINLEAAVGINASVYRQKLFFDQDDKLLVCGSTHPKEEESIFKAYQEILVSYPKFKLLIAPRHPQRSKDIGNLATDNGFMPIYISSISDSCPVRSGDPRRGTSNGASPACINKSVFILDVMGELFNYYAAADIVFMGGSLVKRGGHNILEPASLKKPVIFGPYMFNFRDISELFLKNKAAKMAHDQNELTIKIKEILSNPVAAKEMAERAYGLIIANRGATIKNIQVIQQVTWKLFRS